MKRFIQLFICISLPFLSHAENTPTNAAPNHVENIDQQIEDLQKLLSKLRKEMLNKEMKAQPYMFDNWHEFAEDISASEEKEKQILTIKKKIKELKEQKKASSYSKP